MHLPSRGLASRLPSTPLNAAVMDAFVAARQPWKEYMELLTKDDSEPYPTKLNDPPMYRGRQRGREGTLLKESVQLHYRRYPDEHVIADLVRWRSGEMVGDVALQQFRGAQPFVINMPDDSGLDNPAPDVYMKLNYKNPAVLCRFITRTGHFYPRHIMPMNPHAMFLLRRGLWIARYFGLMPKYGNPFWHRLQADRPKPYQAEYDPAKAHVTSTVSQFSYNWLQTHRIREHFKSAAARRGVSLGTMEKVQQLSFYEGRAARPLTDLTPPQGSGFSPKPSTVPGLISVDGLRRNKHLYSRMSKRRMGFPNPLGTSKRI